MTETSEYTLFTVLETKDEEVTLTLNTETLSTSAYGFSVDTTVTTTGYVKWLVLPKGLTGPTTGEELDAYATSRRRFLQTNDTEEEDTEEEDTTEEVVEEEEEVVEEEEEEEEEETTQTDEADTTDWEDSKNSDYAKHQQEGQLYGDPLTVYDETLTYTIAYDNEVNGAWFWAETSYTLYATL
jgi:hypothetical protein